MRFDFMCHRHRVTFGFVLVVIFDINLLRNLVIFKTVCVLFSSILLLFLIHFDNFANSQVFFHCTDSKAEIIKQILSVMFPVTKLHRSDSFVYQMTSSSL